MPLQFLLSLFPAEASYLPECDDPSSSSISTSAPKQMLPFGSGEMCGVPLDLLFLGEFILEAESLLEHGSVPHCSPVATSRAEEEVRATSMSPAAGKVSKPVLRLMCRQSSAAWDRAGKPYLCN